MTSTSDPVGLSRQVYVFCAQLRKTQTISWALSKVFLQGLGWLDTTELGKPEVPDAADANFNLRLTTEAMLAA